MKFGVVRKTVKTTLRQFFKAGWLVPPALLILALLLVPFAAAPAQAQTTVWSGTLTVGNVVSFQGSVRTRGCAEGTHVPCTSRLESRSFNYEGIDYRVRKIIWVSASGFVQFSLDKTISPSLRSLTLYLATRRSPLGMPLFRTPQERRTTGRSGKPPPTWAGWRTRRWQCAWWRRRRACP